MLNYSPAPPLSDTRILNGLTYTGPKIPATENQWSEGLPYLRDLHCIRPKRRSFELQPNVPITFYADPGGSEGRRLHNTGVVRHWQRYCFRNFQSVPGM